MNVRMTIFDKPLSKDQVPGRSLIIDWKQVVSDCVKPRKRWPGQKENLPGWSFTRWDDNDKRKRTDIEREGKSPDWPALELTGLALDYDDEPNCSLAFIKAAWGRWTYAAHTSASHMRQKKDSAPMPRFRVLLPFSRPVTPEELKRVAAWARHPNRGAGILGDECAHPRRWYFQPSAPDTLYEAGSNEGELLDPDACLAELERWEAAARPSLEVMKQWGDEARRVSTDASLRVPKPKSVMTRAQFEADTPERLKRYAKTVLENQVLALRGTPKAEAHDKLISSATIVGGLAAKGHVDKALAFEELVAAAVHAGRPADEARRTAADGLDVYGPTMPWESTQTYDDYLRWLGADEPKESDRRRSAEPAVELPVLLLYRPDVVARLFVHSFGRVVYWRGQFHLYQEGAYHPLSRESIDALLARMVEERGYWARIAKTKEERAEAITLPDWPDVPVIKRAVVASVRDCSEIRLQLMKDLVPEHQEAPCWLDGLEAPELGSPPPREVLCCGNTLYHPISGRLIPHTPSFFSFGRLSYDYDPDATCPAWQKFMTDLFAENTEAREALQELVGYYLMPDTSQHKIGLVVGPKRAGKGTVARVLRELLGPLNVAGPTLGSLATDFGLWPIIDRRLAIISDARLGYGTNTAVVVERLLSISGEDALTIDRKYLAPWTGRVPARFLILSNELPKLGDASGAIASRFLLITLERSWAGQEDRTLTDRLLQELPGVLVWAMDGYRRLVARGHFVQPESAKEALQEIEDLASPMLAFSRDWCERIDEWTPIKGLYDAWCLFCEESGREHPGTLQTFGRDFRAAFPDLTIRRPRDGDATRPRCVWGLGLSFLAKRRVSDAEQKPDRWRKDWQ